MQQIFKRDDVRDQGILLSFCAIMIIQLQTFLHLFQRTIHLATMQEEGIGLRVPTFDHGARRKHIIKALRLSKLAYGKSKNGSLSSTVRGSEVLRQITQSERRMNKLQKKDFLLNEDTWTTNEKQRLKC